MAYNPQGASSVGSAVSTVLNRNKVAAAAAAYLEAGRIANNQASKLLSKGLPMMIRGYADTPAGRLVVANLAQAAFAQFRPQEPKLTKLGAAMTTAAMQELLQTVDVEGFIDTMLNSDATKKAIAALPADQD